MSEKKPLKIATASDQAIFLHGLSSLVMAQPGASLVGEGRCGKEILQLCDLTAPDLVLLDARECGEAALETIRQIHSRLPTARILLLLSQGEDCPFQDELDALPVYFISREVSEEEFAAAIQQARKDIENPETPPLPVPAAPQPVEEEEAAPPVLRKATRRTLPLRSEELLTRELTMAGRIQTDILPETNPVIPGWDLAMCLEPARETSGDFYDVIPLSGHKCGVVIADVTDKGMGAALFMVLSNTLIRTYAARFPTLPAVVLSAVSERILSDTRSGMFVTTFFGILETNTGRFIYANAGHPPGFLVSTSQRGKISIDRLQPTGMALGVSEQARWKQKFVKLAPGDYLILYTDGITEAQNPEGEFFGEDLLLDVVLSRVGSPAKVVQDALLHEVHQFVGNTPRQDDIALIVIRREDYLTSSKYFRAV